ncbi:MULTISPECIES: helix-turn-helix transcriptional regulator [Holdemanella]|uniref:helix-turn-helix transcriptional regulator n=1 Tax=Holdemanella TaxID=1573535 RepID=UPI00242C7E97|nr:helix-turn-helix transcriptional regulator [Holdemanella biformis]MBS6258758.1 helix-turn-helix transcriptional regulator [Holdemanella biformis]MEE0474166.1 helix-turn-helix transcriptional regulator [Holdemanella biformis]
METMGQRIKKTRKMMKMTQVEFAKLLDVPQPSISAYEKDKYLPSFEVIGKIMKECNVSFEWLNGYNSVPDSTLTVTDIGNMISQLFEIDSLSFQVEAEKSHSSSKNKSECIHPKVTFTLLNNDALGDNLISYLYEMQSVCFDYSNHLISEEESLNKKSQIYEKYMIPISFKKYREMSEKELMETQVKALQKKLNDEKESNNSEEKFTVITGNINNLNDKNE